MKMKFKKCLVKIGVGLLLVPSMYVLACYSPGEPTDCDGVLATLGGGPIGPGMGLPYSDCYLTSQDSVDPAPFTDADSDYYRSKADSCYYHFNCPREGINNG